MAGTFMGYAGWSGGQDAEGNREYNLISRVRTASKWEGPATVMLTAGLISPGTSWAIGDDSDDWAFCLPNARITPLIDKNEACQYWDVEQTFSTKRNSKRCQDTRIENPLMEPQKVSGSFTRYVKEAEKDRHGNPILTTSFELIKGLEKKHSSPSVVIEQNVSDLELNVFSQMVNSVNSTSMWGLGPRKVSLASATWERNYYGSCGVYYTRRLEFEINFEGFDYIDVVNAGYCVRRGKWMPSGDGLDYIGSTDTYAGAYKWVPNTDLNPLKRNSFEMWTDVASRLLQTRVFLTEDGDPAMTPDQVHILPPIEIENEYNYFLLDIPASL